METQETDILVVGAGLTGLTTAFHLARKGRDVLLLERENRVGGQIRTFREKGFTFESGPNTGIVSCPEVAELFTALSPACRMETAREESKRRLIWKGDTFHALPSGFYSAVKTPLFTWPDKFRILGEPFRAKGADPDESVGSLARRRLGKSFLDYAVDPFLSGVYAGDPMRLVTRYALPKLYNLEQRYGSFIKGSLAKVWLPKTERDRLVTKEVFSIEGGMDRLTEALADAIGRRRILLSAAHAALSPGRGGWEIRYRGPSGERLIKARKVITTTGGYTLPELLPFVDLEDRRWIDELRYAPVVQVSVGVRDTSGMRFEAFGGLVPSCEKKEVLGILFPSACFQGRAPEGGALFSFFIGGVNQVHLTRLPDEELNALVVRVFHSMLGFPAGKGPDLIRFFRHARAIPQYEQSSGERLRTIEKLERRYPGLILAGNIKGGIGMADRIRQGVEIAASL